MRWKYHHIGDRGFYRQDDNSMSSANKDKTITLIEKANAIKVNSSTKKNVRLERGIRLKITHRLLPTFWMRSMRFQMKLWVGLYKIDGHRSFGLIHELEQESQLVKALRWRFWVNSTYEFHCVRVTSVSSREIKYVIYSYSILGCVTCVSLTGESPTAKCVLAHDTTLKNLCKSNLLPGVVNEFETGS